MSDFLSFRTMITPGIMKVFCYLGMIICVVVGGVMAVSVDPIGGIGLLLFGPIICRISTELTLVMFEIHSELKQLNDSGGSH